MKVSEYNRIKLCADNIIEKFEACKTTKHRVATKVWKYILLMNKESVTIKATRETLIAKNLGCGIYEIRVKGK